MTDEQFIAYVGPAEIHDAVILRLSRPAGDPTGLVVGLRSYDGAEFTLEFRGVRSVEAHATEKLMLHALTEVTPATPGARRFNFVPWEDDADAWLRVEAADFVVRGVGKNPAAV